MQVSTSALRTLIQQSATAPTRLSCCCYCRGFASTAAESAGAPNDLAHVLRNSTGGPFSLGPDQAGPSSRPHSSVYERTNHPQSQRARLQAHEKRRTVLLNGLGPHMTPGDIRRFAASKLRNPESVLEGALLPQLNATALTSLTLKTPVPSFAANSCPITRKRPQTARTCSHRVRYRIQCSACDGRYQETQSS